jgi:glycosyltransferase involved in cell wall biosynthesis
MSSVGILHYQVGATDGVSLEIDKWKRVLEEMGHTVHLCAGDLGSAQGTFIPEMYHHTPQAERLYRNTFIELRDYADDLAYRGEMLQFADGIEKHLRDFVRDKGIELLLPSNVWSVAVNPPVAIALARVMRDFRLPTVAHHHDFYWERADGVALTTATAIELVDKYLPPRGPLLRHVVINSLAERELWERKGIRSTVVPNVFDFAAPPWQVDDYNRDLRSRIGLRAKDVLILQATRIVRRKGIELAIDFVRALDTPERRARLHNSGLYDWRSFDEDSRIVLVLAGYSRDDVAGGYVSDLRRRIAETGIDALFIEDVVSARRHVRDGRKVYSLWDTYVFADMVTYPSLWEGWGNQFLEALRAQLPVVVFEYPVYKADIENKGFQVISLGSQIAGRDEAGLVTVAPTVMEAAADRAVDLLTNAELRQATVEHNLQLARSHYSLQALRRHLQGLVPA